MDLKQRTEIVGRANMGLTAEERRHGETRGEARRVLLLLRSRGAYGPLVGQGALLNIEWRAEKAEGAEKRWLRKARLCHTACGSLLRSRATVPNRLTLAGKCDSADGL
jgi:hypothetical protein